MSTISVGMTKPCTGKCNLLVAQAGLEYANGTEAGMANGSWLHHIVVLATGPGRKDTVCPMLPGERFFSSGNERTPTSFGDVTEKKVKSTFPISDADGFQAQIELMNMTDEPRSVYLTIDFEYIPGPKPEGWKTAKAMWLDVVSNLRAILYVFANPYRRIVVFHTFIRHRSRISSLNLVNGRVLMVERCWVLEGEPTNLSL